MKPITVKNPKLDSENKHFGNKFSSLTEVLRVVQEALPKDSYLHQSVYADSGELFFRTTVHTPNGSLSADIPFVLGKKDPQGLGSALTYHRRYGLCTLFNLVGEEDDDGNRAQPPKASRPKPKSSGKPAAKKAGFKKPAKF